MNHLGEQLIAIRDALDRHGARFALIGGLAISVRIEPRFTRDIDLAVAVGNDTEAEATIRTLQASGFVPKMLLEQDRVGRLATVRLATRDADEAGVVVDLLFASSGIEPEIVAAAETIDVLPNVTVPVARTGHLVALKLLSCDEDRRPQDIVDLQWLLTDIAPEEFELAKQAVESISKRGYHRDRDLPRLLDDMAARFRRSD